MAEQQGVYNETDAAIFIHQNISESLQKKYSLDDIGFILDLIYEYYETIEGEVADGINDAHGVNDVIDAPRMLAFINKSVEESKKTPLTDIDLEEILMADNDYMDSIGMEDDELLNLDELAEEVYAELPEDVKKKYSFEDVYLMLGFEADYLSEIPDDKEVDEEELIDYIIKAAKEEELEVDKTMLKTILDTELDLIGEEL